jgi:predicted amidophosphoribosyltransferase
MIRVVMADGPDWSGNFNIVSGGYAVCRACSAKLDHVEGKCASCGAALDVTTVRIVPGDRRDKALSVLRRLRRIVVGRGSQVSG